MEIKYTVALIAVLTIQIFDTASGSAHSLSVRYGISYDLNKTSPIKEGSAFVTLRVRIPGFPYVTEGMAMEYDYCVRIDLLEFFKLTPCV